MDDGMDFQIEETPLKLFKTLSFSKLGSKTNRKITENRCLVEVESLQIENCSLKSKLNDLESENFLLKNKLIELEQCSSSKETEINEKRPAKSLPNLKMYFKDLRKKLLINESLAEELKAKMRTKRTMNVEEEIKISASECVRLKNMLIDALNIAKMQKDKNYYETRLNSLKGELASLDIINQELFENLNRANSELFNKKNQEIYLEKKKNKKNKKLNLLINECKKSKNDLDAVDVEYQIQHDEIKTRENELNEKLKAVSGEYNRHYTRLLELENQLKIKSLDNEKAKNINISYRNALRKARTMNVIEQDTPVKLKNPPKFFKKIHEIITKKNMMIEVFLSLFDKYNKRILPVDEFLFVFEKNIKGMKRKYIENALLIMGCTSKYISLETIEEWYGKYDYNPEDSPEVKEPDSKFKNLTSTNLHFIPRKIRTLPDMDVLSPAFLTGQNIPDNLKAVFLDISVKMEKLRISKEKITETLLGEDFDETKAVFAEDLESRLKSCKLNLEDKERIKALANFLCEPEEEAKKNIESSPRFAQISKKLKKFTGDWMVLTESQRLKIKLGIFKRIKGMSSQIKKTCKKKVGKENSLIQWSEFKEIIIFHGVNFQEEIWRMWSLKFYPKYLVDFKVILRKFKTSFPAEDSINLIREKKKNRNLHLADIFNLDQNGFISISEFAKSVKRMYLGLHIYDILELISYLQEKIKSHNKDVFTTEGLLEIFS